jgi:hypothetical protein
LVTILRNDIYENVLSKPKTESVRDSLVNATGELSSFYGKAYMKLNIGGKPYEHNVLLADIQNEDILGIDFLKANKSNVMISKGFTKLSLTDSVLGFDNTFSYISFLKIVTDAPVSINIFI